MNARIVSTTEARKNIFSLTEKVQIGGVHYLLTENGRAKAVLMSAEEYESWKETLEVQSDIPDISKRIARAQKDIALGRLTELADVKANYELSRTPHQRIGKRSR